MDILDFALKMERESEKYYREQAGKTDFLDLRILLEKLADTEAKHYEIVEALRSQNNDLLPEDWTLEETKNIFDSYIKDTEAMCKAISIKKDKTEQRTRQREPLDIARKTKRKIGFIGIGHLIDQTYFSFHFYPIQQ